MSMDYDPQRRRLIRVLWLSIALHGFLLLAALPPRVKPPLVGADRGVLHALLATPGKLPVAAAVSSAPLASAKPRTADRTSPVPPPVRSWSQTHWASPGRPVAAGSAVATGAGVSHVAELSSTGATAVANAAESLPASPSSTSGSSQPANADDLRQYRLGLAVNARRYKRYPPLAREAGWEGTVEVAINLVPLRSQPEVSLVRSSGRPILDDEALAMISKASAVTRLPDGLKGKELRLLLPVEFALDADRQVTN